MQFTKSNLTKLFLAMLALCHTQGVQINLSGPAGPIKTFEIDLTTLPTVADLKRHIMTELNQLPEFNQYNAPGEVIELLEGTERNFSLPPDNDQILNITVIKTRKPFFSIIQNLAGMHWSGSLADWVETFSGTYSEGGGFYIEFRTKDRVQAQRTYYIEDLANAYMDFSSDSDDFDDCIFRTRGTDADLDFIESRRRPR